MDNWKEPRGLAVIIIFIASIFLYAEVNNGLIDSSWYLPFSQTVQAWYPDIERWSDEYNVDKRILASIMQIESNGRNCRVSNAGAKGLFQIIAKHHLKKHEDPCDANINARAASKFLHQCFSYFADEHIEYIHWDNDSRFLLRVAACYNGGRQGTSGDPWDWPRETRKYVWIYLGLTDRISNFNWEEHDLISKLFGFA